MRADWAEWNEIVSEVTFLIITSVQKIFIFVLLLYDCSIQFDF